MIHILNVFVSVHVQVLSSRANPCQTSSLSLDLEEQLMLRGVDQQGRLLSLGVSKSKNLVVRAHIW